jgi:hypothetical protein
VTDVVKLDDGVKRGMAHLLSQVDTPIRKALAEMTTAELNHALNNFSEYLKLDLREYMRDELSGREKTVDDFDDMFTGITHD